MTEPELAPAAPTAPVAAAPRRASWVRFVLLSGGVGAFIAGLVAIMVFAMFDMFDLSSGEDALVVAGFLIGGGLFAFVSSGLVALTAVAFAAAARRTARVGVRALIIGFGTAGAVSVVTVAWAFLFENPEFAVVSIVFNLLTGFALAGGALAPWRFGFARPAPAEQPVAAPRTETGHTP